MKVAGVEERTSLWISTDIGDHLRVVDGVVSERLKDVASPSCCCVCWQLFLSVQA